MSDKTTRERIVDAADRLFYRQGYAHTSFTDIAGVVQISRGNFYHHFKTKDEILEAVIEFRLAKTQAMLERWEAEGRNPEERIRHFIHILIANWDDIKLYGCPVGTLSTELAKLNHASQEEAKRVFTLFRIWLCRQFAALGHEAEADELVLHLLARSQGVAMLANAFHDRRFVAQEVNQMCDWVASYAQPAGGSGKRSGAAKRRKAK